MTETVIRVAGIDYVCAGAVWYEIDTDDDRRVRLGESASELAQEVATLRAQLAGVREKIEKLPRMHDFDNERDLVHLDDVLAELGGDA